MEVNLNTNEKRVSKLMREFKARSFMQLEKKLNVGTGLALKTSRSDKPFSKMLFLHSLIAMDKKPSELFNMLNIQKDEFLAEREKPKKPKKEKIECEKIEKKEYDKIEYRDVLDYIKAVSSVTGRCVSVHFNCSYQAAYQSLLYLKKQGYVRQEKDKSAGNRRFLFTFVKDWTEPKDQVQTSDQIYDIIKQNDLCTIADIIRLSKKSEPTVRRYLKELFENNQVFKKSCRKKKGKKVICNTIYSVNRFGNEELRQRFSEKKEILQLLDECVRRAYDRVHGVSA